MATKSALGKPNLNINQAVDEQHIILDIGLSHTKCGFAKDAIPKHIIPTPLSMVKNMRSSLKETDKSTFAQLLGEGRSLILELEEFLSQIFYHLLQTNPLEKSIVVVETFMGLRPLYEAIGHVCFKKFNCRDVYFVLGNALPLYVSGLDSGILIDVGYQQAQILPIVRGRLCMEGFQVSYTAGVDIEKEINHLIVSDNKDNSTMLQRIGNRLPSNFPVHVIEDLKVRTLMTLGKNQKREYFESEDNILKMKAKKFMLGLGKAYKDDFPYLVESFYTRVAAVEVCFKDVDSEEPNLAHSVCLSLLKMPHENRLRAAQNIMLSGGTCMIPGFKKRLIQEIKGMISAREEFLPLQSIVSWIKVPESIFAPNIQAWVGASILMSLGQEADRFLLTADQYKNENETIPDRFGDAFINLQREGNYFNKNWEINFDYNQQIQFAKSPQHSDRSLMSRTESLASMVQSQIKMGYTPQYFK